MFHITVMSSPLGAQKSISTETWESGNTRCSLKSEACIWGRFRLSDVKQWSCGDQRKIFWLLMLAQLLIQKTVVCMSDFLWPVNSSLCAVDGVLSLRFVFVVGFAKNSSSSNKWINEHFKTDNCSDTHHKLGNVPEEIMEKSHMEMLVRLSDA